MKRISALVGLALAASAPAPALAADLTVVNLNGSGAGSLRQAVISANATNGDDRILFAEGLSGTIPVGAGGQISITDGVQILGPARSGSDRIAVDGGGIARILNVNPATAGDVVRIEGLTLTNGTADSGGGGAIRNQDAELQVIDCLLFNNSATPEAGSDGGAIYEAGGFNGGVKTLISGTTIFENFTPTAGGDGGGIYSAGVIGRIQNSTIAGNLATGGGGGIRTSSELAATNVISSTIAGNRAQGAGDGWLHLGSGPPVLSNAIAADNGSQDLSGGFVAVFSLIETIAPPTVLQEPTPGSNLIGVDPVLGPLQTAGDPTPTLPPGPGSPVIDAGADISDVGRDQRRLPRPSDFASIPNSPAAGADGSDIGAVELQVPPASVPPGAGAASSAEPPARAESCGRREATIVGTGGRDSLRGTRKRDVIAGLGGGDRITGLGADDVICGGPGRDVLFGGSGDDRLFGQGGRDRLVGGKGTDHLKGGRGKDKLR